MKNLIYFQIFECAAAIFETFIVYQYISGLFDKRQKEKNSILWYLLFCFGLTIVSLFCHQEIVLVIYTLIGVYTLSLIVYKTSMPSRIFSIVYFAAIMIGAEIFTSGLISGLWKIDLSNALEYGLPRVLCIVIAKLIQVFLVKISIFVSNRKANYSLKGEPKLMLPLLLCQVFSITLAHYIFQICSKVYGDFELIALFTMVGLIYINIVVFWYFDRVKIAFELQSKNEAAEYKLELQKKYHETLSLHQQETDRLWHDMKKHINLMKTLINSGHHTITSEYIQELESQMSERIKIVRTDYPVLNALLTEQKQRAKFENVAFEIDVKIESNLKINPVDLCIILGNLYENAFAACALLPLESNRYINTAISQRNGVVTINMQNTYSPNLKPKFHSNKHGLGLKNIKQALLKYNGKIDIIGEEGVYKVSILVP